MQNVSEQIKKALLSKGWTQRRLCTEINVTENGFRKTADGNTWKLDTIVKIAEVLEMPVSYFISDNDYPVPAVSTIVDEKSFGAEVLTKIVEEFNSLKTQLSIKDRQIDGLQRTVDALLGNPAIREKSFNKPVSKAGKIIPLNSKNRVNEKEVA